MEFPVLRLPLPFLISSLLMSGCIMTGEDSSHVEFNVGLSKADESIRESYVDGDLISVEPAIFEFDFSSTDDHRDFISYGVEAGGQVQVVSPSEADVILSLIHI